MVAAPARVRPAQKGERGAQAPTRPGEYGLTSYGREFRVHWRALAGATLGLGSGLSINGYVHSILAPYLLTDFGWSKAQLALIGSIYILGMISIPLAGRVADVIGARKAILFGLIFYPLSWVGMSMMTGDIRLYYAINVLQLLLCATTTTTVYCRVVAERFTAARGIALGIMACGPAIAGAVGAPVFAEYVSVHGWRAGAVLPSSAGWRASSPCC